MTPQQIASLRQQQQHSSSGPPPLLLAPRASVPNVQVQGQRIIQQGLIRVANVANSNVMVNIPQVRTLYEQTSHTHCTESHRDHLETVFTVYSGPRLISSAVTTKPSY